MENNENLNNINNQSITPVKKPGIESVLKKPKNMIILGVLVLVLIGLVYYFVARNRPESPEPTPTSLTEEQRIQKQLAELDALRNQQGYQPMTEAQVNQQLKELDALRKKQGYKPLTEEQISKQLEELNKLKSQQ